MSIDIAGKAVGVGSFAEEIRRTAIGLSLAGLFGLAIGFRHGLASMAVHAVGVPLGYIAAVGLALPALCIFAAHFDLPVDTRAVVHAVTCGVSVAGLVLAGIAPGALLLTATSESHTVAAGYACLGLALGSVIGVREVAERLGGVISGRFALLVCFGAFVVLAGLLAARAWWLVLPMLGRNAGGL
jgi:hypothetical protein